MGQARHSLLTPEDAGELLKVSAKTVKHWLRRGKLPGHKLGGTFNGAWRLDETEVRAVARGLAGVTRGMADWDMLEQAHGRATIDQKRDEINRRVAKLLEVLPSQTSIRELIDRYVPGGQLRDISDEDLDSFRGRLLRLSHITP